MSDSGLLLACLFVPLAGAIFCGSPLLQRFVREFALAVSLVVGALAILLISRFPANGVLHEPLGSFDRPWLGDAQWRFLDIRFSVGLDGLGLWLFGLTTILMLTSILVSWRAIEDRKPLFYGMLLLLECGCLGVFSARDVILFYVFFEFTLIPLFFLIGIWGSEDRRYAAIKFFLFTLAGSVLTFLGLLAIVICTRAEGGPLRFSIEELTANADRIQPFGLQLLIFLALFAGFAIKVPLFPLHTWLPLAHVQAPTAGSVMLAGVMLKIGIYGFLRFSLPMLPDASVAVLPIVWWLAVIGILYGAFVALAQHDIKRLIAYSSISHLGFCMLGLFAMNPLGIQGGTLHMLNHGLSTGALFALVGMLYERYHTREISEYGGLARRLPWFAFFFLFFTFSSIGLPGLNGFVGEFTLLLGAFERAWTIAIAPWRNGLMTAAVLAVSGVVLGAWYMLFLVQRILFGGVKTPRSDRATGDLTLREFAALAPLAALCLWIGLQPRFFLDRMGPDLQPVVARVQASLDRHGALVARGGEAGEQAEEDL